MPELPEVETVVKKLDRVLAGKVIKNVEVLRKVSFKGDESQLVGKQIYGVDREAKMIVMKFENWNERLIVHLKMTGQLIWRPKGGDGKPDDNVYEGEQVVGGHPTEDWVRELPGKHTRVVVEFVDGSHLFFNDMRVFGWMKLMKESDWEKLVEKLPPDVIDKEFSFEYLKKVLEKSGRAVKLVIMDQGKIGGIGNIYACDGLNLARIDPRRAAKSLSDEEIRRLHDAVVTVVERGVKYGGATYSTFKDPDGLGGEYQEHFLVYDREGEKCKNCGGVIEKIKLGGRGTYFCPKCQK